MKKTFRNWLIVIIVLVVVGLIGLAIYAMVMKNNNGANEVIVEQVEEEERKVTLRVAQIRYVKNWSYNVKTAESLIGLAGAGELTAGEVPEIVEVDDDGQNFDRLNNLIAQESLAATESLDCLVLDEVELVFNNGATLGLQLDSGNSGCIAYYTDAEIDRSGIVAVAPALVEEVKRLVGR